MYEGPMCLRHCHLRLLVVNPALPSLEDQRKLQPPSMKLELRGIKKRMYFEIPVCGFENGACDGFRSTCYALELGDFVCF